MSYELEQPKQNKFFQTKDDDNTKERVWGVGLQVHSLNICNGGTLAVNC
jgi:hypothetical protein